MHLHGRRRRRRASLAELFHFSRGKQRERERGCDTAQRKELEVGVGKIYTRGGKEPELIFTSCYWSMRERKKVVIRSSISLFS